MALTKAKASNILLTTPAASSNDTTPATTAYVTTALANLVDSAPSTLNTLNELAAALGDDANFSTTVTNSIAAKLPLAGGDLTGRLTITGADPGNNVGRVLDIFDSTAVAADVGGGISLYGKYQGSSYSVYGQIIGAKTNSTSGDYSGYLSFKTRPNNALPVERMRINSDGDVTIGVNTAADGAHFQHYQSAVRHQSFQSSNGDLAIVTDNNTNPAVYIKGTGTADLVNIFDNTTEVFTILDGGNVGIGTSGPATNLHVYHPTSHAEVRVGTSGSSDSKVPALSINNTAVEWSIATKADNHLHFRENTDSYSTKMIIKDGNGFVGIGSANPRYNLTVAGNNSTAIGIGVDNASGSSTLDIAALGTGYNNHQAGAGEVWFYSPDNINIGGATGNTNDVKFLANNSVNMIVKGDSGNVGINFASPNHFLEVNDGALGVTYPISVNNHLSGFNGRGSGIKFKSNTTDQCKIFYYHYGTSPSLFYEADIHRFRNKASSATQLEIGSTGNASLTGSLTQNASDERLKNKITEIPNAIDKIKELKGVSFEWKGNGAKDFPHEDGKKDIGVIAQDVQKVLPEAVGAAPFDLEKDMEENSDGSFTEKITSKSGKDYLTVHSEKLIPVLIQGFKEQQTIIEDLKSRITELEG